MTVNALRNGYVCIVGPLDSYLAGYAENRVGGCIVGQLISTVRQHVMHQFKQDNARDAFCSASEIIFN